MQGGGTLFTVSGMTVIETEPTRGRPRQTALTKRIVTATIDELASHGPDRASLARIARAAGTSQQALFRRWGAKSEVLAGALEMALAALPGPSVLRGSGHGATAEDLTRCLATSLAPLAGTALGQAYSIALTASGDHVALRIVSLEHEARLRLTLRQILIATPFEAEMDARIALGLGFLRLAAATPGSAPDTDQLRRVAELILGLIAPRAPVAHGQAAQDGLPGL